MEISILIFIVLAVLQCEAKISESRRQFYAQNNFTYTEIEDGYNETALDTHRILGGTDVLGSTFPWMVSIIEIDGENIIYHGPGVIVNKHFVLCHSYLIDTFLNTENAMVVSKSNEIGDFYPPAVFRRGKEVMFNYGTNAAMNLGLLRVCPSFDASYFAPMPSQPQVYDVGTSITLYNYSPRLLSVTKTTGSPSDCSYPAYTIPEEVICTARTPIVVQGGDYRGTIAVINNKFAGFVIAIGKGGELVLNISQFLSWIATTAVYNAPY